MYIIGATWKQSGNARTLFYFGAKQKLIIGHKS